MADFITFMCPGDGPNIKINIETKNTFQFEHHTTKSGGKVNNCQLISYLCQEHFFETSPTVFWKLFCGEGYKDTNVYRKLI